MSLNHERSDDAAPPSDSAPEPFSPDGVDLTLIRWMLSLTPTERLQMLQQIVGSLSSVQ